MPRLDRSTQINVVLAPELDARLRAYLDETGFSMNHVINRAVRRDLDNPPPIPVDPPLPPAPPEKPGARRRSPKK